MPKSILGGSDDQTLQKCPIQMKAFHSNENGLFCTHPLSVERIFQWKERGKQEALI